MAIRPLGDRILVKPLKEEEVRASGIVLPDTASKEKKAEGTILALGAGEELAKLNLSVGNNVLFKKWGGEEVEVDGDACKILNHDDVVAVIE
ncbi:MAG: co-chaperone GroES [Candidatus Magasanikbacteria bacterium]|nr:co-chaperone GroES [Candidatus Magasanikbacteria bacterium]